MVREGKLSISVTGKIEPTETVRQRKRCVRNLIQREIRIIAQNRVICSLRICGFKAVDGMIAHLGLLAIQGHVTLGSQGESTCNLGRN